MYLDLTKSKGEELMRVWNSDLDTILIFVGHRFCFPWKSYDDSLPRLVYSLQF